MKQRILVVGDEQILANLVDNAVNHTDEGGRIEISVESELGNGSTFSFSLPAAKAESA